MDLPNRPGRAADTVHALSSGPAPAGIAVIRVSGPDAGAILDALAGPRRPEPRRAVLRTLRDEGGEALDRAMVLWLPAPATVTGENVAEFHVHGGRAVIDAVLDALTRTGSRMAEPGEFTRRALFNGRTDLAAVEGLADLLAAETETQRREALRRADGTLGRMLDRWTMQLIRIAAAIEAAIDYDGDEEEVSIGGSGAITALIDGLVAEIDRALAAPPAERLREGIRVAIVGPPNAGKSTLFNALVGDEAAIVSAIEGTTRDIIERPLAISGVPFVLSDSAGIRDTVDPVERIGVARAEAARAKADIVLDLSPEAKDSDRMIAIHAKSDLDPARPGRLPVSAHTGEGMPKLIARMLSIAETLMPGNGEVALDRRYREALYAAATELRAALLLDDLLLVADCVRAAREQVDRLTGSAGVEEVLDALFGRFCLGK